MDAASNTHGKPDGIDSRCLEQWVVDYLARDSEDLQSSEWISDTVESDVLDMEHIKSDIRSRELYIEVKDGFCILCEAMLASWPDFGCLRSVAWWLHNENWVEYEWYQAGDGKWTEREVGDLGKKTRSRNRVVRRGCHSHQLEASARRGCKFCGFLIQGLQDSGLLDLFRKVESRLSKVRSDFESLLVFIDLYDYNLQTLGLDWPGKPGHTVLRSHKRDDYYQSCLFDAPDLEDTCDELGVTTLQNARRWLETCTQGHVQCNSEIPNVLPTRLISVQGALPRLVETAGTSISCRYATLSHSWGSVPCLKLTRSNLILFTHVIPYNDLGQCFKDAISITKRLNIDYLWIDSLCILQDDEEDWERESGKMHTVYTNTYLNIAAADATDGNSAILVDTDCFGDAIEAPITYRGELCLLQFRSYAIVEKYTIQTHLASRAWTLQEKLLSPRTLHLGRRGGFWECQELVATDSLPRGVVPLQPGDMMVHQSSDSMNYERWGQIVEQYTEADLSFDRDKLPALSGVARAHSVVFDDQYLAGMWRSNLKVELGWSVRDSPRKKPSWRAPSWSWASVNGPIRRPTLLEAERRSCSVTELTRILSASTVLAGTDPFGQVKGGNLRLCCNYLLVGRLQCPSSPESALATIITPYTPQHWTIPFRRDYLDEDQREHDITVYMIPMSKGFTGVLYPEDGRTWIHEKVITGLVLIPSENMIGQFSRMGSFEIYNHADPEALLEPELFSAFLSLMKEHGRAELEAALAGKTTADENCNAEYVIEIV